jgi:hypothetical protein
MRTPAPPMTMTTSTPSAMSTSFAIFPAWSRNFCRRRQRAGRLTIHGRDMLGCVHGLFWTVYRRAMRLSTTAQGGGGGAE